MTTHLEVSVKDFGYAETSPLHYGPLQTLPSESEGEEEFQTPIISASNRYSIIPAPSISQSYGVGYENEESEYQYEAEDDGDDESQLYTPTDLEESELNTKAIALFAFTPENENEIELFEGQQIWINYRYGQGWLVASDLKTGEMGLIPEEYVRLVTEEEEEEEDQPLRRHIVDEEEDWQTEDEGDSLGDAVKGLKV
ncbi:hypothetical protein WICPIJ_001032 [Wickerhamomyces pijperi]|uniref:SH3 domain-containing protein n=1 Tax=Wickerhamomyces pijperi TaxID=599730 RepID=A0A9P8QEK7_WICPI|nr:hypothetical protein WICPIJ_001032 [Wickerhamomyces pijperi]